MAILSLGGCKKDERPDETPVPQRNMATLDIVTTEIGTGLALRADAAPTSVRWERVIVLDADRAVLLGRENDQAWALRTNDRGRTWTSVSALVKPWASWGVAGNGALSLVSGVSTAAVANVPKGRGATPSKLANPIGEATVWYSGPMDRQLDGPRALLPGEGALVGVTIPTGASTPALYDEAIALLAEKNRVPTMVFAPLSGGAPIEPISLEKAAFVPVPYGRPPKLLSVAKGTIELRNWPRPGETLGVATPIPGYRSDATTFAQLSDGPGCEAGGFSFRRFSGVQPWVVGISGDRALAFKVPGPEAGRLGCSDAALVVETTVLDPSDAEKRRKVPQLVRCGLDGTCAQPKAPPFAVWTEKHDRDIWSVPTKGGLVAVLRARSGSRWGLYLGQSTEGGNTFELPRTIGEGADTRRVLDFGALLRFPDRLVLLISADVGTTGRRGWYALASDDEGNNWGPP